MVLALRIKPVTFNKAADIKRLFLCWRTDSIYDIENKENRDFALGHEIDGGFQQYLKSEKNKFRHSPSRPRNESI